MENITPGECAQKLAVLMAKQLEHYRGVLELAIRQGKAIDSSNANELMLLLAEKQRHISEIDRLNKKSGPYREAWESIGVSATAEEKAPVEQVLAELKQVVGQIVDVEEKDRQQLEGTKKDTGKNIAKLQMGKALNKAYGKPKLNTQAKFKDKQG